MKNSLIKSIFLGLSGFLATLSLFIYLYSSRERIVIRQTPITEEIRGEIKQRFIRDFPVESLYDGMETINYNVSLKTYVQSFYVAKFNEVVNSNQEVIKPEPHQIYLIFAGASLLFLFLSLLFSFGDSNLYQTILNYLDARRERVKQLTARDLEMIKTWEKLCNKVEGK